MTPSPHRPPAKNIIEGRADHFNSVANHPWTRWAVAMGGVSMPVPVPAGFSVRPMVELFFSNHLRLIGAFFVAIMRDAAIFRHAGNIGRGDGPWGLPAAGWTNHGPRIETHLPPFPERSTFPACVVIQRHRFPLPLFKPGRGWENLSDRRNLHRAD